MTKTISTLVIILFLSSCSSMEVARGLNGIRMPETGPVEEKTEASIGFTDLELPEGSEGWTTEEKTAYLIGLYAPLDEAEEAPAETVPEEPSEAVEADFGPPEEEPAPMVAPIVEETVPEAPQAVPDPVRPKDETDVVKLGNSSLPMWFVYTFAFLFLSILFTLCYISRQRKESYWRRMRD